LIPSRRAIALAYAHSATLRARAAPSGRAARPAHRLPSRPGAAARLARAADQAQDRRSQAQGLRAAGEAPPERRNPSIELCIFRHRYRGMLAAWYERRGPAADVL